MSRPGDGGPVVLRTLADYQPFTLRAFCPTYRRSVPLDHEELARHFGWDTLLDDIRTRLRCQQCGRRPHRLIVGYHQAAVPDGRTASPSNVREWW